MRMNKEPTKTGFEVDVVEARHWYCYLSRSRVCKKAKRQMNKRFRRKWKSERRDEMMTAVAEDGEGWVSWNGGDRPPCDDNDLVCVALRVGDASVVGEKAKYWDWEHRGEDSDIVKWRFAEGKRI